MVIVDFVVPDVDSVLGRSWVKSLEGEARSIKDVTIRYKLFYSQVEFSIDGVKFLSKSSFVPLVDLGLGMSGVVDRLASDSDGALDFTEHDEVIKFVVSGQNVEVVSSKNPATTATAKKAEMIDALTSFVRRAHDSVVTFHPAMSENATVARLRHAE
ncbi:hypothetical protein [Actinoplanes auranticolor]|uniref:Uncharacterized protein n=1 Tax=Actinoplanes auranticolor TaxID=47988 RepID=A0A919SGG9_9ACTN|nr:hypothetical protein [Actinoplanes auranticolor]GIM72270.1 hypothetical protein Aau02nite_50180 [Actinoplanes auranticolor]